MCEYDILDGEGQNDDFMTETNFDGGDYIIIFNSVDDSYSVTEGVTVPDGRDNHIRIKLNNYAFVSAEHNNDFGEEMENPTIDDVIQYTKDNFVSGVEDLDKIIGILEEMKELALDVAA